MLKLFYQNNLKYDIINKFCYFSISKIPKLKKLILIFNSENFNSFLVKSILLKFICKKNVNSFKNLNKSNILVKIKKGHPIQYYMVLKNNCLENFLETLFKNPRHFSILVNSLSSLAIHIKNFYLFKKLEKLFNIINNLRNIKINLIFYNQRKQEIQYIVKNFKNLNYSI